MRWSFVAVLLLPLAASAQNAALPGLPVETVHSDTDREIETVTSRPSWHGAGSAPLDYRFGTATTTDGTPLLMIQARVGADSQHRSFGTLMQTHSPDRYLGKRIRLSGRIKTENVRWVQMWLRVDGTQGEREPLSFYNMAHHEVEGTTAWQKYEIVLDVPKEALNIAYGFFIAGGRGTAYMDSVTLQPVGNDVPVTGSSLNARF